MPKLLPNAKQLANLRSLFPSSSYRKTTHFSPTSAAAASAAAPALYRKISRSGDPNAPVTPLLDQWVREGKTVTKANLKGFVVELTHYKRFNHALEISLWMSDKMYIPISCDDVAARLNLILKVHGLEQVENYFNQLSENLKRFEVYTALLSCYAREKAVEKAEETFRKMKDLGLVSRSRHYNILMNLYHQIGNYNKLDAIVSEMESNGVNPDRYSFCIFLTANAATSNIEAMDNIVQRMEAASVMDWDACVIAADLYLKVGLVDKARALLTKSEETIPAKRRKAAFDQLLQLYARTGEKDEVYRIWKLYKRKEKIYNKGYMSMMSSLLRLNDIDSAEKILREWKSQKLSYDFRILRLLIDAYCKSGLLEKAESLIHHAFARGNKPSFDACYSLISKYLEANQIPKAKKLLKKAIELCPPGCKPSKETLATCLKYMEGAGDSDKAEEFVALLRAEGIFSPPVHDRLLDYIKDNNSKSDPLRRRQGDSLCQDKGTDEIRELS